MDKRSLLARLTDGLLRQGFETAPADEPESQLEQVVRDELEQAKREERGDVHLFEERASTPATREYAARMRAWRDGGCRGEPPSRPEQPSLRDGRDFHEYLRRQAAERRARVRPLQRQLSLERCRARRRIGSLARSSVRGPRVRASRPRCRTRPSSSRGDPHQPEGEDDPDGSDSPDQHDHVARRRGRP